MSYVRVEQLKRHLKVDHFEDDLALQDYIDDAEEELLLFMDRKKMPRRGEAVVDECASDQSMIFDSNDVNSNGHWPGNEQISDSDDLAPSVRGAVYLIAQGMYEGKDPAEMAAIRTVAETKVFPFRNRLGV